MKKLQVGVFMGGKSIEIEVSFNSGRTVCDHLDTACYDVLPIFQTATGQLYVLPWRFLHRGKTSDFMHRLENEAEKITWDKLKQLVDFVFLTVHGRYAEDGTIQGFLELLDIPYLGSKVLASAISRDKAFQKTLFKAHNINVPQGIVLLPHEIQSFSVQHITQKLKEAQLDWPLVVKPTVEGSSLGISVIFNEQELLSALEKAAWAYPAKMQPVLIEEKLEGMEFCSTIITDYSNNTLLPLPPTEVVIEKGTHFFDYKQKYMPGLANKHTPARCTAAEVALIQDTCIKVTNLLNLTNMIRIDGFLTSDGRVIIIDVNTITGMAPASFLFRQAAELNMSHTQLINHIIETELHTYGIQIPHHVTRLRETPMTQLRVAVLFGGRSNEKEISLESGRNIIYKLSPQKYSVIPIFVDRDLNLYRINHQLLVRHSTEEISDGLDSSMRLSWAELPALADFVFIGLHGGEGENGCVQGALEMLGMPYNGSGVLTSALCMDKYKTNQFLKIHGFAVPQEVLVEKDAWHQNKDDILDALHRQFSFPIIVKPHDDGCSVLVFKAAEDAALMNAITILFNSGKNTALIEEYINGTELTVGVIGNEKPQALPPSQAIAMSGILSIEEKFLPGAGENQTPAPLPPQALNLVKQTVENAYATLGCKGYARVDCFYQTAQQSPSGKERVVLLEFNTLPAMTPATCLFHQAAELGIKPMDFIDIIVEHGLKEHLAFQKSHHQQTQEETTAL